jgi:hypothetical protein
MPCNIRAEKFRESGIDVLNGVKIQTAITGVHLQENRRTPILNRFNARVEHFFEVGKGTPESPQVLQEKLIDSREGEPR